MNRLAVACFLALSACAHVSTSTDLIGVVKNKASFEMNCPATELTVVPLSGGQNMTNGVAATSQKSYGVEGCGHRTSYYAWCTNMMGSESCDAMQTAQTPKS
jgi:hypothetical protein